MTIRLIIEFPDHLEDEANEAIEADTIGRFVFDNENLAEDVTLEV